MADGHIHKHLQSMFHLLRNEETLKMVTSQYFFFHSFPFDPFYILISTGFLFIRIFEVLNNNEKYRRTDTLSVWEFHFPLKPSFFSKKLKNIHFVIPLCFVFFLYIGGKTGECSLRSYTIFSGGVLFAKACSTEIDSVPATTATF